MNLFTTVRKLLSESQNYPAVHVHPDVRYEVELQPDLKFMAKEICPHCHWTHTYEEGSAWRSY